MSDPPRVFITRPIPKEALEIFTDSGIEYESNPEDVNLDSGDLIKAIQGKQGLLCLLGDALTEPVLESLAQAHIKGISNLAVGFNNIDIAAASRLRIPVTNTPDVLTETTADLAWTLVCAVARRVVEGDRFVRSGSWKGWGLMDWLGADIHGATLGILGAGRIGTAVARRGHAAGMQIVYHSQNPNHDMMALEARFLSFEALLRESDFLSIHLPLNQQTRHKVSTRELNLMKRTSFLINTARGSIVDETALAAALKSGVLAGAGLDVYENEPRVHPELLKLSNVILLPHVGSATRKTRIRMASLAAKNLAAMVKGQRPPNLVNPEIYKA